MAAERGHMDIVRYLVRQKADINIKDKNGVSIAAHVGDLKLVINDAREIAISAM